MKFKNHIEVQAGIKDSGNSIGSEGQILSSTGEVDQKVEWINQSAITASSDFIYYEVKNETGSTILKGKGVRAVGTDGNSGHILVDEMVADGTIIPRYFLGVLETDIENGGFARAIAFGELDQFNTNGQNGETWVNGQILWCDPDSPGDFTITEPLGPNVKIPAAFVLKASTQGKIQIRVQANESVKDLYDTKIDSQVDGDVLVWDNTTGVWFNDSTLNVDYTAGKVGIGTVTPQEKLHIYSTGAGAVRAEIESTQATDTILKYTNSNRSYATFLTQSGNFSIYDYNAASHRFYMLTNGNIGIGTTSPSHKLTINASNDTTALGIDFPSAHFDFSANSTSNYTSNFRINDVGMDIGHDSTARSLNLQTGNQDRLTILGNGNVGIGTINPPYKLSVQGTTYVQNGNILISGGTYRIANVANISQGMGFPSLGNFAIENVNVGIGTTSPTALLTLESNSTDPYPGIDIKSTSTYPGSKIRFLDSSGSEVSTIESWSNPAISYLQLNHGYTTAFSSTLTLDDGFLYLSTAGSERMRITSNGNVGIGTTSPQENLHVQNYTTGESHQAMFKGGAVTVGDYSYISLNNGYSAEYNKEVRLAAVSEQSNSNKTGFAILTSPDGNGASGHERLRVTADGNVGIGTTNPNAKLEVVGTTGVIVDSGSSSQAVLTLKGDGSSYGGGGVINIIGGSQDYLYYATNIKRSPGTFEAKEEYEMYGHTWRWDGNMGGTAFQPYTSFDFKSQGSSQMVIYNNNVGIGTTSPSQKLHVIGGGYFQNGTLSIGTTSNVMFNYITTFCILAGSGQIISLGGGPGNVNNNVYIGNGDLFVPNGNVGIGTTSTSTKLQVNGGVQLANDTAAASASKVGTFRYRTSGNNSYVDMCMQTGASTYSWVNIVTNSW